MLALDSPERLQLLERAGLTGKGVSSRLNQIAEAAVMLTGADHCEVNVIAGSEQKHVAYSPDPVPGEQQVDVAEESACLIVVQTGQALILDDVTEHPHCAGQSWAGTRISSYLGVPVHYEGVVVGSLCVFTGARKHWTRGELTAMAGMASLVEACFPL